MSSPSLYWTTVSLQSQNIESCADVLTGAHSVMQNKALTSVQQSAYDVSGRTANTHAAVMCVKLGPGNYLAVIMVGGTDNTETKDVRAKLKAGIEGLNWL